MIYQNLEQLHKALTHFKESLKIREEIGDQQGIAASLGNIGAIYHEQGNLREALEYHKKSMKLSKEVNDQRGIALDLTNIGSIYLEEKDFTKALEYYSKAEDISEEADFKLHLTIALNGIGKVYLEKKEYKIAADYSRKALGIAQKIDVNGQIKTASETLFESYKALGLYEESLKMHELYISSRDSLKSEELQKELAQQEYREKTIADSVATAKEKEIQQAKHDAEIEKKQEQQYFLYGGIALVLVFSGFMYNRFRVTQQQKEIIEEQKEEVETQRDQIEEQRDNIIASINYAKRIQEAILPSLTQIKQALPQSFVLYEPKDVVAGDFYWQESVAPTGNKKVYIASADCTGHGVPGAIVSVVCSNALTKAVLEDKITDVGKILDNARNTVVEKLAKSGDVKDGMDISLACFDIENMKLEWAGANNPLYLLRENQRHSEGNMTEESVGFKNSDSSIPQNDEFSIQITKGDREPIGLTENPTPFTTHIFDLQKGDSIYLFTDGYADQFGGNEGKKLGYKKFREKLIEISNEEMSKQKELLSSYFNEWKGTEEQVDDVCVIGIKV